MDGRRMTSSLNILHFSISKQVIAIFLLAICFCMNAFGHAGCNASDSITVSQLYEINNKANPYEITFNTEEQVIQSHDGQKAFCTNRRVEYKITRTDSKLVVKRKVVSSEKKVLCKDKEVPMINPDFTTVLLSSLVKPRKMKIKDMLRNKLECSISKSDDGCVLFMDKLRKVPKNRRKEKIKGGTIICNESTEMQKYSSYGTISLDALKEIISNFNFSITLKNGSKHHVEVKEDIIVLK